MKSWIMHAAVLLLSLFVLLRRRAKSRRLPPGPLSLPLFGNLLWLRNSAADVEPLLLRLFERYGPVVTLRIGSSLNIFVADRHLAHAALVGPAGLKLSDRPRASAPPTTSSPAPTTGPRGASCCATSSPRRCTRRASGCSRPRAPGCAACS
jgi:hypothetical protein